jgi:hypothetical protein
VGTGGNFQNDNEALDSQYHERSRPFVIMCDKMGRKGYFSIFESDAFNRPTCMLKFATLFATVLLLGSTASVDGQKMNFSQ